MPPSKASSPLRYSARVALHPCGDEVKGEMDGVMGEMGGVKGDTGGLMGGDMR